MKDKLNRKKYRTKKEWPQITNNIFSLAYSHEKLFKLFESSIRTKKVNFDEQLENMDESDKVCYEENIVKEPIKFKG